MKRLAAGIISSLAFFHLPVSAQNIDTVTFDNSSDLSQFSFYGQAMSKWAFDPGVGVGGSGGLRNISGDSFPSSAYLTDAAVHRTFLNDTIGNSLSIQVDYKAPPSPVFPGPDIRLGFMGSRSSFDYSSGRVWAETYTGDSSHPRGLAVNAGGTYMYLPDPGIIFGHWSRMRIDLTRTAPVGFTLTVNLYDLGSQGLDAPFLLATHTLAFQDNQLANNGSEKLSAGFWISPAFPIDNFTAKSVPEPSAESLLSFAGALCVFMRLKKRARVIFRRSNSAMQLTAGRLDSHVSIHESAFRPAMPRPRQR